MPENDLWSRVMIAGPDECWLWTGSVDTRGYGHLRYDGRQTRAHRLAYRLACGEIPPGEGQNGTVVMHSCDRRICCNPKHLSLGTHADNMADMKAKGRRKNIGSGAENGRAVLTPSMVQAIRADTRGTRTIAKDYPVSRAAIQRIKSGKAWSCLAT